MVPVKTPNCIYIYIYIYIYIPNNKSLQFINSAQYVK